MKYAQIKDCADVASGNFMNLISAVIQQPVAVAVESSKFKLYKEGVFDGACTEDIDAGVLRIPRRFYWLGMAQRTRVRLTGS